MDKNAKILSPTLYAERVGYTRGRITQLKDKLITEEIGGRWFVVVCEENDNLFKPKKKNS